MQTVVLVIHLMLVAALIGVVLLQRSEGGGLGIGGGGVSGFMSSRGTTNLLTRTTAVLATGFFITSLFLAWHAGYERKPASIIGTNPAPISGDSKAPGNLLDSLKKPEAPATPAAPAAPAAPQAPQSR